MRNHCSCKEVVSITEKLAKDTFTMDRITERGSADYDLTEADYIAGEERLAELLQQVQKNYSEEAAALALDHWNRIQHPLHGLGLLEDALVQIAGLVHSEKIHLEKKAVVIFCADNGVTEEHVTQTGSYVTGVVARNLALGTTSVCRMAQKAGVDVIPVDMGIKDFPGVEGVLNRRIGNGTGNLLHECAMSREDAVKAILTGIDIASELKSLGYNLLGAGEMGIGNTTTAAACTCVLLGADPALVTGKGAGLSDEGLRHKIAVVNGAIRKNGFAETIATNDTIKASRKETVEVFRKEMIEVSGKDVIEASRKGTVEASRKGTVEDSRKETVEVLRRLGGYDILGMCGLFLGGLIHQIPVLIDGAVSSVAALAAARMCPDSLNAMLASHVSSEPAGSMLLKAMGKEPLITARMHLGEGTGSVLAMPLLDMALSVYDSSDTFEEGGVEAYRPL